MKKRGKILAGVCAGVILCTGIGYLGWCSSLEDTVIWSDVSINGISLKGLSKEEAGNALQAQFEESYQDAAFTIHIEGQTFEAETFPVLSLHAEKEIDEAYLAGHGEWYLRGRDWLALKDAEPKELHIEPLVTDPDAIDGILEATGIGSVNTFRETACELTDQALLVRKGNCGVTADMDKLAKQAKELLQEGNYTAEIECPVIPRELTEADLTPYYEEIHTDMRNAAFTDNGKIISSRTGVSFDLEAAEKAVMEAAEGEELTFDFILTEPEITETDLMAMLYKDVLGEYVTYGGGTSSRITNIKLACQACDGVIIQPGETFSYNETLGERTAEKGYQSAVVYANGQVSTGIGGGICQVSSTLFAACLYADLEIVQRSNHSRTVAYLPLGMDAAVSWGGPDLQIKNNTKFPVKLQVSYAENQVSVKVLGMKRNEERIEISTEPLNALTVRTYREHYNAQGGLIEKEEVAYSRYLA